MNSALFADLIFLVHAAFILFAVAGGVLVARWPKLAVLHLPAAAWGVAVELFDWSCPLTPLEDHFRQLAGEAGYTRAFLAHYLDALLYPGWLTREIQIALGTALLLLNLGVYRALLKRRRLQGFRP